MRPLKLNRARLMALLLAAALLVPMCPAARAETVIDPPAQEETGTPPTQEEGDVVVTPPDGEVTTTPNTPEAQPLTAPPGSRADTPNDTPLVTQAKPGDAPEIQLESNLVLDALGNPSGFVELAVRVTTSAVEPMRSLSLTVGYSDLLTPVDWSTGGDVTLGAGNFSTHIPAKHSDKVTGAAAYGGGTGRYLYIEAESIEPATLTNDIVAVVRFRYDVNTTPLLYVGSDIVKVTNVGSGYDPGDPTTAATAPVGDLFPLAPDAVAATEPRSGQAVWFESADNSFYYVNGYDGTADTEETVSLPVNNAPTNFQKPITAGATVLAVRADKDPTAGIATEYYSFLSNLIPTANITTAQVSQPSYDQSGGGITLDDVRAVVALSWSDEFIGSAVVANGAKQSDIAKQIDSLTASLFEHYDNTKHPSLEKRTAVDINSMYDASTNSAQHPLTCHKGYNFAGWILVDATTSSEAWTAYDTSEAAACLAKLATAKDISAAAKNGTVYLKAAYVGNVELNTGQDTYFYEISKNEIVYNQFGATSTYGDNTYSISLCIQRQNNGKGSTRMREPTVLQEVVLSDGTVIYTQVIVLGDDKGTVELACPEQGESVKFTIYDASGAANWIAPPLGSVPHSISKAGNNGYQILGTLGYINKITYANLVLGDTTEWNMITLTTFRKLGITTYNIGAGNVTISSRNIATARNLLLSAMANNGNRHLTYEQLVYAMNNNGLISHNKWRQAA